ncbi:MAG: hypothetical protein G8237_11455 [Magnetococcales bacterium]|nr:hypothetical protein [Magnetococcales bacterium]
MSWFLIVFLTLLALIQIAVSQHMNATNYGARPKDEKKAHYLQHAHTFNLLLVGDSRTYCGLHPEILDPLLGTHSYNLAFMGHWFPTQYPQFLDLLDRIPPSTTVLWSIGHQNFLYDHVNRNYPIPWGEIPNYLLWGFGWKDVLSNRLFFTPFWHFYERLEWNRGRLQHFLERPAWVGSSTNPSSATPSAPKTPDPSTHILEQLRQEYRIPPHDPLIPYQKDGHLNSIAWERPGGGHYRIELRPRFYREQQEKNRQQILTEPQPHLSNIEPLPPYLALFETMLAHFKSRQIRLIVNELEEAPHMYATPETRDKMRQFMQTHAKPKVLAHGFSYIRADLDQLQDADYFDYNHLNSQGVTRYSPLLAEVLRPLLNAP